MRNLLILSLFIQVSVYAQKDHIQIKKEKQTSYFPNIAGYSYGEMNYSLMCSEIAVNGTTEYEVDKFTLQYGLKEFIIYGNTIPDTICVDIGRCCINGMVFITNITGINKNKDRIFLYPINLTLIKND